MFQGIAVQETDPNFSNMHCWILFHTWNNRLWCFCMIKSIQVSSCQKKKYYSLRHLGSRAYRFKFDVSYHIFRHVEIWNMHCLLNHLGIDKILSFNSVLDKFTHIVSNFHISQIAHFLTWINLKNAEWLPVGRYFCKLSILTSLVISRFCGIFLTRV